MIFLLIEWLIIFFISVAILVKSSDYLLEYGEKLGFYFKLPSFIIGATLIAIGTSLPELLSSIVAVLNNISDVVVSNVVGSNITNILLVLGVAALFAEKYSFKYDVLKEDVPSLFISAIILLIVIYDGNINIIESFTLTLSLMVYLYYSFKKQSQIEEISERKQNNIVKNFLLFLCSIAGVYIGAKYTIESLVKISELSQIEIYKLSAFLLALSTSLPELVVSTLAARKGKIDISIGNVIGSNIFNIFGVVGISGLFGTLVVPINIIYLAVFMTLITGLLFIILIDQDISKREGFLMIILYILIVAKIYNLF